MRIAIGQLNTTVGAFEQNATAAAAMSHEAAALGAALLLLPEQTLPGYPARDFLQEPDFIARGELALQTLARETAKDELGLVVGHAARHEGVGAGLHNAAALLAGGKIVRNAYKLLLPTYDVFDEARYFDPGSDVCIFEHRGVRLAITICEDIWNDKRFWQSRRYERDPIEEAVRAGAQIVLNLSASPYSVGKPRVRERMLAAAARRHRVPIVYCNMVGGNDSLVFDGQSLVIGADGAIQARGKAFEADLLIAEVEPAPDRRERAGGPNGSQGGVGHGGAAGSGAADPQQGIDRIERDGDEVPRSSEVASTEPYPSGTLDAADLDELEQALVLGLRDYLRKTGFERVVLGLSGGIDSAVTAALAANAIGAANVIGIAMPSRFTAAISNEDAAELASNLGMRLQQLPIQEAVGAFKGILEPVVQGGLFEEKARGQGRGPAPDAMADGSSSAETISSRSLSTLTEENLQARSRGVILMAISNELGALLLTTGNKSELAVGYCTLYGDMAGGLSLLGDLPKTTVYALARHLNRGGEVIPERTIVRPPSAELREEQTDQDSLPPYEVLDRILQAYVLERRSIGEIVASGEDEAVVHEVLRLVLRSEFKRRQAAPSLKVSPRAFGEGWRFPIAHGYRPWS